VNLVTLHGFTGRSDVWNDIAEGTHLDVLGHSDRALAVGEERFADEVDRIARQIPRGGENHLVGYSLGARLALGVAVRFPERCAALTLIGVHPGLSSESDRDARRRADQRWINRLETVGIESFVETWEQLPLWDSQKALPKPALDRQRQLRLEHEPLQLAAALRAVGLGSMPCYWDALDQLDVPVHFVVGELDRKFLDIARRAADRVPGSAITVIDECGHNPLLERPDSLRQLLADGSRAP